MSESKPEAELERAQMEVQRAKKRLASTMGSLQYRLKPATLMNNAWEGVREKGGVIADDALAGVKDRPKAVSGVLAAIFIFLARHPLLRLLTSLFTRRPDDADLVKTSLDHHDENYDLTAPTVERSSLEGVNA